MTPHPGEAARILARAEPGAGWSAARVQGGRLAAARSLAGRTRAIAVLKGAGTVIAAPDGTVHVAVAGSSALATAGSGDCLSGLVGALLASGLEPATAARAAVHVHGVAGDLAAARYPRPCALDIADAVPEATTEAALRAPLPGWPRLRRG